MARYTIYILENKINGKRYVGQTTQRLRARLAEHRRCRRQGMPIASAIAKHGWQNFSVTSFDVPSLDSANALEAQLINGLETLVSQHGYNLQPGGRNCHKTEDERENLRRYWAAPENSRRQSQNAKESWRAAPPQRRLNAKELMLTRKGRWKKCAACGDSEHFDSLLDFGLCPSCRQLEQTADELGISPLRKYRAMGSRRTAAYFAGFKEGDE